MSEKINPALDYPLEATPGPGAAVPVRPGVHWLRVPIPFELNHINLWLLDDGDGYTLVDTGISSDRTRKAWDDLFDMVIRDRPLKRVIVTHFHPDHFGLARWLCERSGAAYLTSAETRERTGFLLNTANETDLDSRQVFYQRHGIEDTGFFEDFLKGSLYTMVVSGEPRSAGMLAEGETVRIGDNDWQVIMTYGHAPGHINLYCAALGLLISGDQVLPTISSNVSVYADQPDANPLEEYLDSFTRFEKLPADTIVLPSHGKVFQGLHTRIDEITRHHQLMLEQVHGICSEAHSAQQLVPKLFRRKLEGINTVLAFGETMSHLNYLCAEKRLRRELQAGRYLYQH